MGRSWTLLYCSVHTSDLVSQSSSPQAQSAAWWNSPMQWGSKPAVTCEPRFRSWLWNIDTALETCQTAAGGTETPRQDQNIPLFAWEPTTQMWEKPNLNLLCSLSQSGGLTWLWSLHQSLHSCVLWWGRMAPNLSCWSCLALYTWFIGPKRKIDWLIKYLGKPEWET